MTQSVTATLMPTTRVTHALDATTRAQYLMAMGIAAELAEDAATLARSAEGMAEHGRGDTASLQCLAESFERGLGTALRSVQSAIDACDPAAAARRLEEEEAA